MPLQKIDIGLSNLPVSHRDNGMTLLEPAEKAYLEQSSVTVESCRGDQLLYWTIQVKSPEEIASHSQQPDQRDQHRQRGKIQNRSSPRGADLSFRISPHSHPPVRIAVRRYDVQQCAGQIPPQRQADRLSANYSGDRRNEMKSPDKWKNTVLPVRENSPMSAPLPKISNFGISGANSAKVLTRELPKALRQKPTLAVVLVGTNDSCNSHALIEPMKFRQNLSAISTALEQHGAKVILMTPPPFSETLLLERHHKDAYSSKLPVERAHALRKIIREEAAKNNRFLLDLEPLFLPYGIDGKASLLTNPANSPHRDGLHPNAAGYRLIASELAALIQNHRLNATRIVCLGDSITYGVYCDRPGTSDGNSYPALLQQLLRHSPSSKQQNCTQ